MTEKSRDEMEFGVEGGGGKVEEEVGQLWAWLKWWETECALRGEAVV